MRNIKITLEYEGTNYSGWQIQNKRGKKKEKTLQQTLERALSKILQEKIKLIGSGRTDAGAHARGQVANFKTKSKLACRNIQRALNSFLPEDIRIEQAVDVHPDFHARFCVRSKLYRYTIVNNSFLAPHLRHYAYLVKYPLNIRKMRQASRYLLGRHNFRSLQAVEKQTRDPVRTIKRLDIRRQKELIYLDIEANGFLYRMVRNIVGTLIEIGRGKIQPQEIKVILRAKMRIAAGPCAPAKGLCLREVKYKA